jgi:hypothetical protein
MKTQRRTGVALQGSDACRGNAIIIDMRKIFALSGELTLSRL